MKWGDLAVLMASETVGEFRGYPGFVVHPFNGTHGEVSAGSKPVEQEVSMGGQGRGELDELRDASGKSGGKPSIEESAGVARRPVLPEEREVVLEQVGRHGGEVGLHQVAETAPLLGVEVRPPFQQYPTGVLERDRITLCAKPPGLGSSNVVDGFVAELRHVEAVENVDGLVGSPGKSSEERPPHVGDDELKLDCAFCAEPVEELTEGLGGSVASNPEESSAAIVDLVDQGQVVLALRQASSSTPMAVIPSRLR